MATESTSQRIGKRIAEIRAAKKLSQRQLATMAGVGQTQIANIELGNHSPNLGTLEKVLDALEMTLTVVPTDEKTQQLARMVADIIASEK